MMNSAANLLLVTGAAGWLGQALLRALLQGLPDVPAMARPAPGLRVRALLAPGENGAAVRAISPDIEIVEGDVRSRDDCARFCREAPGATLIAAAGIIQLTSILSPPG